MKRGRKPDRQLVDGEWMTINQLAKKLGRDPRTISYHLRNYPGMSFQRLADRYRAGEVVRGGGKGRTPVVHQVHGRGMTVQQAAEAYGFTTAALYAHMDASTGRTLEEAVDLMEDLRDKRAERNILNIIRRREAAP